MQTERTPCTTATALRSGLVGPLSGVCKRGSAPPSQPEVLRSLSKSPKMCPSSSRCACSSPGLEHTLCSQTPKCPPPGLCLFLRFLCSAQAAQERTRPIHTDLQQPRALGDPVRCPPDLGTHTPTLSGQQTAGGTPLPGSPVSRALPSGTGPARPPSPWLAQSRLRGQGAALQTLQPHRLLPGHHLLQLFGDSQQLLFQAHVGPRRPAGLGAQGSSGRQSASRTGPQMHQTLEPGGGGAGRAPPSAGGGVAGTKYRLQGLPGQRLPEPGGSCLGGLGEGGGTNLGEGALPTLWEKTLPTLLLS